MNLTEMRTIVRRDLHDEDANNYRFVTFNSALREIVFQEVSGGVGRRFNDIFCGIDQGVFYNVRLEVNNGLVTVTVDGCTLQHDYGDTIVGLTGVGARRSHACWDDFHVIAQGF